ncbi:hypothetical protein GCM10022393_11320 [Aquimarina addita]|uniref:Spermidine synthase n=1 Tax=Aquimarina addita TaxID=870485 RepID=A0ABP7XDL5_9FLAO
MEVQAKTVKANIYSHTYWIRDTDADTIRKRCQDQLLKSGFTIVKFDEYHFPVKGYTCFWLLAESHLAIHTFPDDERSYVELSSCNQEKLDCFVSLINQEEQVS